MNSTATLNSHAHSSGAKEPPFNIVISYDTARSARRAMRLVDNLAEEFGREFDIHREVWRFDVLGLPSAHAAAVTAAAQADLLIVASDSEDLPSAVRAWLNEWSDGTTPGTMALVALVPSRASGAVAPSPARRFLQAAAAKAAQDFFSNETKPLAADANLTVEGLHQRAEQSSSVLSGILEQDQPVRRWGIND